MTVSRLVRSATIRLLGAAAFVGAALLWFGASSVPVMAQTGGPPEVTVDLDVLNSLDRAPARHRDVTLHHPNEPTAAPRERKPSRAAAKKPNRPPKKAAVKPARPVKRAAVKEPGRTPDSDELRDDADRAARDDAIWEADRKREEANRNGEAADRQREEMARIKREEAERMRQAKAEIEEAGRSASPAPAAPVKSASDLPNPGPGPETPPEPKPAKPGAPPAQIAAVSPPPASPPQQPPPAPVKPKPAALEKSAPAAMPHVDFAVGGADLSPEARSQLDAIAKTLGADENKRVQLVAYATGSADEANQARRLSLSRALNVRAYLIDHGVRNTRMDVRALGNRPDGNKSVDRVDIVFLDK